VSLYREDVSKSELIVGEFSVSPSGPQGELSVRITGPNGFTAFEKRNANDGKFAFTSSEPGEHRICFTNAGMSTSVAQSLQTELDLCWYRAAWVLTTLLRARSDDPENSHVLIQDGCKRQGLQLSCEERQSEAS